MLIVAEGPSSSASRMVGQSLGGARLGASGFPPFLPRPGRNRLSSRALNDRPGSGLSDRDVPPRRKHQRLQLLARSPMRSAIPLFSRLFAVSCAGPLCAPPNADRHIEPHPPLCRYGSCFNGSERVQNRRLPRDVAHCRSFVRPIGCYLAPLRFRRYFIPTRPAREIEIFSPAPSLTGKRRQTGAVC